MRILLPALTTVLVLLPLADCSAQEKKTRIEIAAVSIAKVNPDADFPEGLSRYRSPGIEVDLYFEIPDETILSINSKESRVVLMGNDGVELELQDRFDGPLNLDLNEDKTSGVIQLQSETIPGKKVSQLSVKGKIALTVGKDPKSEDVNLKLEEGAKLQFGPISAEIASVAEGYSDEFRQVIEISSKTSFDAVAKIEFLDAKGEVIKSEAAGSSSFGFDDNMTYSRSWQIASDAKTIKVRATYFQKTASIQLPTNLEFGLGL